MALALEPRLLNGARTSIALSEQFRVYVLDLLGFGLSDRPSIDYTEEIFTDLVGDFLREVIARPTVVVAHGLTSAYVIANAYRRPQLFERLVLVSPPSSILEESLPGLIPNALKYTLRTPVIGQFLYNILTSRRAIEGYYDRQGYHNPGLITDELVEYVFSSAHQSNSRFPAASLLSGNLHMDVYEPLARLQIRGHNASIRDKRGFQARKSSYRYPCVRPFQPATPG